MGSWQWAVGSGQLAIGSLQWAVGSWQLAIGSLQCAVGSWQLAVGSWQLGFRWRNWSYWGEGFIIGELIFWELLFIRVEFIGWKGF